MEVITTKLPRLTVAPKRKLKPGETETVTKSHKIVQMLKSKSNIDSPTEIDDQRSEAEPPEAFPLEKDASDVDEQKETDKEMNACMAKFANIDLNNVDNNEDDKKYPDSVSPPLQELSPTTSEPMPVYQKPQRNLMPVNKLLNCSDKSEVENVEVPTEKNVVPENIANVYKFVTFGLEIKKAMEECQNIINTYNQDQADNDKADTDGPLSLDQIVEAMMDLEKNSPETLEKIESDDLHLYVTNGNKLTEIVENMPQILANMPEIASKLSEFANASFELPEFASIMNNLPDVNTDAQLTPETLKQIRELKLVKRDGVKVTKNTAKRKNKPRVKCSDSEVIDLILECKDNVKDEKQNVAKDDKDTAQGTGKVANYVHKNESPILAKYLEEKDMSLPKNIRSESFLKASTLFERAVKDAHSMDELKSVMRLKFNFWKEYIATKLRNIPVELLQNEVEGMLEKFYTHIQEMSCEQTTKQIDDLVDKVEEMRDAKDKDDDEEEGCQAAKESLRQITKLLSTSAGNTFDLLIMKLANMSPDKKSSVKILKFKYYDVIKRCADSQQLAAWIMVNPHLAIQVIQELTGMPITKEEPPNQGKLIPSSAKVDYFMSKLREMNRNYMKCIPKTALCGDQWLIMLFKLEEVERLLKESFLKIRQVEVKPQPTKTNQNQPSEAEILAAKGLSKIIGKSSCPVKKEPPKEKPEPKKIDTDDKKTKNDALLAKCEAILTSKDDKALLESFYTIKSYITQGLPVPETYKKHVISICCSIDARLLDEDIEETLKGKCDDEKLSVSGSQNPERLTKYSAQALKKQTLNEIPFENIDLDDEAGDKNSCKYTNDCACDNCRASDVSEEKAAEWKARRPMLKAKAVQKPSETATHQQHVCKGN
ncbi:uncharacterized protein LOC126974824 [Leptidea sinapis]|uniref:uncharacterized protein LOC126974824 n=1 Tax=Leptidea sinapis TaxID=189913 RepID=UPI0021C3E056|nr:uncharacterized protein LOC126974824 [Leptidea sinapis]